MGDVFADSARERAMTELRCHYCRELDGADRPACVTLHDKRGCKHVCIAHAKWRFTTSWLFGHSPDCLVGGVKS